MNKNYELKLNQCENGGGGDERVAMLHTTIQGKQITGHSIYASLFFYSWFGSLTMTEMIQ